ncbi:outer membrane beta-barrel protein [Flavobacterium sp.]|jgi:hypothetical protein|uniref:outer membrane beta-barrel protein n=1 Tax=Flavobacterium sp. TaxID=239 RepID=UPI0037BF6F25
MKKLLSFSFLLIFIFGTAQELSYGPILGANFYDINNNNGSNTMQTDNSNSITFGAYGEYNFTEKIGIKTELLFLKTDFYYLPTKQPFEMNILSIAPNFKYDFGDKYRKGFYMLVGPKLAFATSIKSEGEDVKDSFETIIFGAQLGFGYRVLTFIDLQAKIDYDVTPFFKLNNGNKSKFFAAIISFNVDLAKILSSK